MSFFQDAFTETSESEEEDGEYEDDRGGEDEGDEDGEYEDFDDRSMNVNNGWLYEEDEDEYWINLVRRFHAVLTFDTYDLKNCC